MISVLFRYPIQTPFADKIIYNVGGFCEKNADNLKPELQNLMHTSTSFLVATMYPDAVADTSPKKFTQAEIFLKQLAKLSKTIRETTVGEPG